MLLSLRLRGNGAAFVHPLSPPPRTAILVPGFQSAGDLRVFSQGWDHSVERFAPAAVAGTFEQLLGLVRCRLNLTHAVICLSWTYDGLLSAAQRDLLWTGLGVPIFEQFLGPGNVLLAYECEAHGGLHTTSAYTGPTVDGFCECKKGLRASFLPLSARVLTASA